MADVKKKIWPKFFEDVKSGKKRAEVRVADFDISEGDTLVLEEYNPETKEYTGRKVSKPVRHVFKFKLDDFNQRNEIEEKGLYIIEFD